MIRALIYRFTGIALPNNIIGKRWIVVTQWVVSVLAYLKYAHILVLSFLLLV